MDQETGPLTDRGEATHVFPDPLGLPSCSSNPIPAITHSWWECQGINQEGWEQWKPLSQNSPWTRNAGITKLVDMQRAASLPASGPQWCLLLAVVTTPVHPPSKSKPIIKKRNSSKHSLMGNSGNMRYKTTHKCMVRLYRHSRDNNRRG